MAMPELFEVPTAAAHACYLAQVVDVADPQRIGRVQVKLFNVSDVAGHDAPVWARVAVPFAGENRGAFMIPDVGNEVLVSFVNGDFRFPIVIGGLWNGAAPPPETLGGAGDRVDRWTIVGKKGTRIAIVEEMDGRARISLTTPGGGPRVLLDETAGGKVEIEAAGSRIVIDTSGITIDTPGRIKANASQVEVSAGLVNVNAAMSKFSGIVQCDTLIATTVISSAYTPGAGNIW